jgi:hypothetical protein
MGHDVLAASAATTRRSGRREALAMGQYLAVLSVKIKDDGTLAV